MKNKGRIQAEILGVMVDITSKEIVLRGIRVRLFKFDSKGDASNKFFVVTPNPEQVMLAQTDQTFAKILNSANFSLPDGIGLVMAHKFLKLPKAKSVFLAPILYFAQGLGVGFSSFFDQAWLTKDIKPVKGREIFLELIKLANRKGWRVYLLGGWDRVAERTKINLEKNFKKVVIEAGTGPVLNDDGTPINKSERDVESEIVKKINGLRPHLLFVGFRAPAQEKWVSRWFAKLNIGGAMVVGGTFDYISGKKKLPPKWISDAGLEWLWRLLTGDQKTERISKAFAAFPLRVFLNKLGT